MNKKYLFPYFIHSLYNFGRVLILIRVITFFLLHGISQNYTYAYTIQVSVFTIETGCYTWFFEPVVKYAAMLRWLHRSRIGLERNEYF